METLSNFDSSHALYALGWTLIHSLWQVLVLLGIVSLLNIFFRSARVRYAIACAGLTLTVMLSALTFAKLLGAEAASDPRQFAVTFATYNAQNASTPVSWIELVKGAIESNIPYILIAWMAGAFVLALRLLVGWSFINRLRNQCTMLADDCSVKLEHLAAKMLVARKVLLAQSKHITTPMVIGYFKPIILLPMGMVGGLSADQLEAILLHELAHIKRHDFVINISQSCVEVLFFFNPFVWILSAIVRREREFCCDDLVLAHSSSRVAYARALTMLEEARLEKMTLGMTLADDRHQLFTRIKRIMESSLKNEKGRNRFLPFLLVTVGLLCASWLTIQVENKTEKSASIAQDTVIRKSKRVVDEDRWEYIEEDVEDFEAFAPFVPPVPAVEAFPPFPAFPADVMVEVPFTPAPPFADFDIAGIDSVPGFHMFRSDEWEQFSKDFEQKFQERFGDFYKDHQKEIEQMLEELETNLRNNQVEISALHNINDVFELHAPLAPAQAFEQRQQVAQDMQRAFQARQKSYEEIARQYERNAIGFERFGEQLENFNARNEENLRNMEHRMKIFEERMKKFDRELREELIKDGYISKDDKVHDIHWSIDGKIEINDKYIRDEHKDKYNKLHKKYFEENEGSEIRLE